VPEVRMELCAQSGAIEGQGYPILSMKFQAPEGALKWWSILWILFGLIGGGLGFLQPEGGQLLSYVMVVIGLCSLGLWFRLKFCAYVLIVVYVLTMGLIVLLIVKGVVDWTRIFRLLLTCYFIWLLIGFIRGINAGDGLVAHRAETEQE
jgi:hypothetical protein